MGGGGDTKLETQATGPLTVAEMFDQAKSRLLSFSENVSRAPSLNCSFASRQPIFLTPFPKLRHVSSLNR